ncbi:MAG: hypothetical protein OEV51_07210 [Nitrospira sp.]|nr:hypothetical protein [Nitrospira sp.]
MPLVDTPEYHVHHKILSPDYEKRFVDTRIFPPSTPFLLRGLAAALERGHSDWRPIVSQLAQLLRPLVIRAEVVAAGGAYGAALVLEPEYPGPALLLYGAVVNTLFQENDTPLCAAIDRASALLQEKGLIEAPDLQAALVAARERAQMGRVSAMMKREFARGLRINNRYDQHVAQKLAKRIVDSTHLVRHKALVDRLVWKAIHPTESGYFVDLRDAEQVGSTDPFQEHPATIYAAKSLFQELLGVTNISCTALLVEYLVKLRDGKI